jgi:hypothetical protein
MPRSVRSRALSAAPPRHPQLPRSVRSRAQSAARRVQNPRCQAWAAWGRARVALADDDPGAALRECRRAVDLLQDREFPWALARLHALLDRVRPPTPGFEGIPRRQADHP